MKPIGEKIKELRKSKGISQTLMADACGIKQSSYANIENGKTQTITIEVGKGIAKTLNVSFNELFDVEDPNFVDLNKQHKVWEKEMQDLWVSLKEKNKQLEEKDLLIELLKKEREIYKQSVIISIESYYTNLLLKLEKEIKQEKDEKKRKFLQHQKEKIPEDKQRDLDNFLYMGFLTKENIDSLYSELQEHFSKYNQNK